MRCRLRAACIRGSCLSSLLKGGRGHRERTTGCPATAEASDGRLTQTLDEHRQRRALIPRGAGAKWPRCVLFDWSLLAATNIPRTDVRACRAKRCDARQTWKWTRRRASRRKWARIRNRERRRFIWLCRPGHAVWARWLRLQPVTMRHPVAVSIPSATIHSIAVDCVGTHRHHATRERVVWIEQRIEIFHTAPVETKACGMMLGKASPASALTVSALGAAALSGAGKSHTPPLSALPRRMSLVIFVPL